MIYQLKKLHSRAANAENPKGMPGLGGLAGHGRKGSPCIEQFAPGQTITLLDSDGPGVVRHIWCTYPPNDLLAPRNLILRMYWDHQTSPSVEVPIGDFFGMSHARRRHLISELFSIQQGKGMNCWIPMPFRHHARITVENDGETTIPMFFYQVDFTLGDALDDDSAYFHAQFRRSNPCPIHEDYSILDDTQGRGVYLGTYLGVRSLYQSSWWGEGEVKFYLDGETHPTICGTGAEDYIGFAWGLEEGCAPDHGCSLCDDVLGLYAMYRFHIRDPIYFNKSLRVTIQQIGYGGTELARDHFGYDFRQTMAAGLDKMDQTCYFDRSDDYCSVAFWYQELPTRPFPDLPAKEDRVADLMIEHEKNNIRRNDA
jgi:hypothetical protein